MLTIEQEDQLIADCSAALEEIHSASSIDEVYLRFLEAVQKVKSYNLHLLNTVTKDDFSDPNEDEEIEFILPLLWTIDPENMEEESDHETELNLIFNYAKISDVYAIFSDVDFYSSDYANEIILDDSSDDESE